MSTASWPSFFPSECPPSEAKDASVEVFRLVASDPPTTKDFESYAQTRPKYVGNCKASGLSVFTTRSDVSRYVRRVPGQMQGITAPEVLIASATLSPEDGKILHTPRDDNSHHTWWAPSGFDYAAAFKVVS